MGRISRAGSLGERRVAITGLGVVTSLGDRVHDFWHRLVAGRSGVKLIAGFDTSVFPTRIGAEVGEACLRRVPEKWKALGRIPAYGRLAASQAIADAGLPSPRVDPGRIGVCLASGPYNYFHSELIGPCAAATDSGDSFNWDMYVEYLGEMMQPGAAERRSPGTLALELAQEQGCGGPVATPMTACASATQALGDAARWIRQGAADCVIAGAADSCLNPLALASFCLLGTLSRRNEDPTAASRPFERGRDGFVLGEGAGVLVLEELDQACKRGAQVYAEISGFGSACDAYRVTDSHPEGIGAVLAMKAALADARLDVSQVGYINAHGTSTRLNDPIETRAIREVFGKSACQLAVSSTKSMVGHLLVAAGAVEAIATVMTLHTKIIHPTINYDEPDPECDLDYVPNQARSARVDHALSNSFAFGGQCSCVALSRFKG
ncbi:MAG: beta-ketoacyl synthase [Acidobacteriota bacterium]